MKLIIDINETYFKQLQTELKNSPDYPNLDYCQIIIARGTPYKERPQGEWVQETVDTFRCSECNHRIPIKYDEIDEHTAKIIKPRFCVNCGAYMRKGDANEVSEKNRTEQMGSCQ